MVPRSPRLDLENQDMALVCITNFYLASLLSTKLLGTPSLPSFFSGQIVSQSFTLGRSQAQSRSLPDPRLCVLMAAVVHWLLKGLFGFFFFFNYYYSSIHLQWKWSF